MTALVTGANKGLGRETARRLAGLGWTVFLTARDAERGREAAAGIDGDVTFVELDAASAESVSRAAEVVGARTGRLDVLVNNAGVGAPADRPEETVAEDLRGVFEVNVLGPIRVTNAFLPLLRASADPRVIMVSSGMGSIAVWNDPRWKGMVPPMLGYPASKAALNMVTAQYAAALPGFRVNAVDPGFTATDLNGHTGVQTLAEGTDAVLALATAPPSGATGGFFDRNGEVPW
ncbi:short-chain dehydrogenase [Actinorhabdospora filicis]|uniref:Short-chain dehydrogenase n=2 Tax=Actinorhabdospora filicis TaxID=1785913 RepID=A0A9W6SNQ1_9ACTN|nr:short-chain dehydrogenase [Actinorhabdospora filicis]